MLLLFFAFLIVAGPSCFVGAYFRECYVVPCTRDVIVVIDGSSSMKTSAYVSQEINIVIKLINGWTYSESAVRLAPIGAYIANDFPSSDYYTDESVIEKRLQQFRVSSMQYGLFEGDFNTTIRFLDERFIGQRAYYGPRDGVQKRVIIFTAHSNSSDIASTKSKLEEFANKGYAVTIIGIGVTESVYHGTSYHKFFTIPFAQLSTPPQSLIDEIIEDGVCFYDKGVPTPRPQSCTTSTTTTTTKAPSTATRGKVTTTTPPPRPTHPPFPVGDFANCSCDLTNLYIDLVFVIDTSLGMGDDGLSMIKASILTLVGQMSLDPNDLHYAQVGIVKYSRYAKIVIRPDQFRDVDDFSEELWNTPELQTVDPYAEVDLRRGLDYAAELVLEMRRGVKKAIAVYAASYTDEGTDDAREIAERLQEDGITLITVGFVEPGEMDHVSKGLGEIASPRMNFTSYKDEMLIDEVTDAFCQVNCHCPNDWIQLVLNDRKFGECYKPIDIDANWKSSSYECPKLHVDQADTAHLVYINSEHKNAFVNEMFLESWDTSNLETPNYHIGYVYNETLQTFQWTNGVTNNPYTNWDEKEPNTANGKCSRAMKIENGNDFKWHSIDCLKQPGRAICEIAACDTFNYCTPLK